MNLKMVKSEKRLANNIKYNRRDAEYHQCIEMIKSALTLAKDHSLNSDLEGMLSDILDDAISFQQSELDDIRNGF